MSGDAIDQWVALFANRDEMAWEYARWIANEFTNDWGQINEAIIRRWSVSGLLYIKRRAWSYVQGDDIGELCAAGPREFDRAGSGE